MKTYARLQTTDMTQGNAIRHILHFAVPLFIGTVFQQLYSFFDTMIAGRALGDAAIAAIGASGAVYSLIISFANGLNSGYGLILSRAFGAKDKKLFRRAVAAMLMLNIVITVCLTIAALIPLRFLLRALDTPTEIFEDAHIYILIILSGMLLTILYNMCAALLRAVGNSRVPLYFLMLSCGINILLDLLFIVVFSMGIGGAAAATVIATGISAVCCRWYIHRHYDDLLPKKSDFRPDKKLFGEMLSQGLSMALMLSVFSLGSIILQRSINQLGTSLITAHTASRRIYEMLMMPLSTLATANSTFVSQNFGAGKQTRIASAMKQVMLLELAWSLFSLAVALLGGTPFIRFLTGTADMEVISNALLNLRISTLFFFPLGILLVLRTTMQAMEHKIIPVLSSTIELFMKVAACLWVIPSMGYLGVAMTEPAIWVMCAIFLVIAYSTTGTSAKWVNRSIKTVA